METKTPSAKQQREETTQPKINKNKTRNQSLLYNFYIPIVRILHVWIFLYHIYIQHIVLFLKPPQKEKLFGRIPGTERSVYVAVGRKSGEDVECQ